MRLNFKGNHSELLNKLSIISSVPSTDPSCVHLLINLTQDERKTCLQDHPTPKKLDFFRKLNSNLLTKKSGTKRRKSTSCKTQLH